MGSGPEEAGNAKSSGMGKSKSRMGKNNDDDDGGAGQSCRWFNLCFLGNCMPSRSRIDISVNRPATTHHGKTTYHDAKGFSDTNTDPPVALVLSSSATSNMESTQPAPNRGEELKIASQLRKFTYNELKAATRNFRPECLLGEGGFGSVYKGWINANGCTPVRPGSGLPAAVKTLNQNGLQGHKEWLAEVNYLGELQHPHLVKLIGYCMEDDQRLLVYEFMPRGSLENHLFKRSLPLPWCIRMKVVLGAAMGLAFLHEEAERPVIYRDFKASNILLDAEYNAKLSDFGLAKDGPEGDKTHVSTRVMGTYGYAAPEYVMTGHLTSRSDVYSFGVVLLEMLSGRRSMDRSKRNGEHNLVEWARPFLSDRRRFYRVIDPCLEGHFSVKGAQKSVELAATCLSRDPKARPLMSEVVETLKPLPQMKDMACDSPYFRVMKSRFASANPSARNSHRLEPGLAFQKRRPARSLSIPVPNGPLASPYNNTFNHRSPKPSIRSQEC